MPKELLFLKAVQVIIGLNTILFMIGVMQARKGNIPLHRKINGITVGTTLAGVLALVITVFMGWDYQSLTTPLRMTIHRSFSSPLLILLILTAVFGFKGNRKWHLRFVVIMIPFWIGTLITGVLFF